MLLEDSMPEQMDMGKKEVAACGELVLEQGPARTCNPHGKKTMLEQSDPDRLDPAGKTHARAVPEGLSTVIMVEQRKE